MKTAEDGVKEIYYIYIADVSFFVKEGRVRDEPAIQLATYRNNSVARS